MFILGPSHHVYLNGCALSTCTEYHTPLGKLPLDRSSKRFSHTCTICADLGVAIEELYSTGEFSDMDIKTDEDEHSIEMHLPYVRKIFEGYSPSVLSRKEGSWIVRASMDVAIVPILVGAIDKEKEVKYGALLAPFLARQDTFCVISSDFCHWCVA